MPRGPKESAISAATSSRSFSIGLGIFLVLLIALAAACTREVVKEVEVPGETVIKEVVKEVSVEVVVKEEVIKEVEVVKFIEVTPVPEPRGFDRLGEAPILAQKVAARRLPPVVGRLPKEPLVLPVQEIGRYGGTLRRAFKGPSDWPNFIRISRTGLVRYTSDGTAIMPGIAKGWEASDGGKVWTFYLREGMKWSDGAPFTADDFVFQYEDVILNEELSPTHPTQLVVGGELAKIEKVDRTTSFLRSWPRWTTVSVVSPTCSSLLPIT